MYEWKNSFDTLDCILKTYVNYNESWKNPSHMLRINTDVLKVDKCIKYKQSQQTP